MHQIVPTIYYFFWVRYHPSKIYSQKKSRQETKYRPPFPPTTKPHPLNPLNRGLTSLVLAGYRLVVPWPFCACSTIFCVCLPRRFCRSRLVLFWSATCFVLFFHAFLATFVIFLWFGFSFLHVIPAADTSCHSLFLFVMLLHISFHAYPFIQKNLGLSGPDNVDWIKRVLGSICLCLPKPSCQKTVFCGKFVFYGRFVFCCRSLSLALLSLDLSYSLVFLASLWALLVIELSSVWVFGYGFAKMGINNKNYYFCTFNLIIIYIFLKLLIYKLWISLKTVYIFYIILVVKIISCHTFIFIII